MFACVCANPNTSQMELKNAKDKNKNNLLTK